MSNCQRCLESLHDKIAWVADFAADARRGQLLRNHGYRNVTSNRIVTAMWLAECEHFRRLSIHHDLSFISDLLEPRPEEVSNATD